MHLSLKKRIILFFLLAMMLMVGFFALYFYQSTRDLMAQSERSLEAIVSKSIEKEIADNLDFTEANVKAVVENQKVQELFAKRDREGLYEYMLPTYKSMKEEFPQAHFHLPDSVSFLRMNKPEKFGDSLKDFRFTVNEANSTKKTVKGIEAGVSGFGFRVVMPVFYEGTHIGSFEYGRELEHSFLETLKESYNGDFLLYKLEDGEAKYISSTISEDEIAFPYPEKLDAIQNGEVVDFESDLVQLAMITLNNKNGEIVGVGGGRNYGGDGGSRLLNRALQQYKQPGSSIKPVLEYALAFEYLGYSLDEVLVDRPITYPAEQRVLVNYNGKYEGDVTIKDAMANSLNTPAIQTLEKVTAKIGSDAIVDYLKKIGFSQVKYSNYHLSYAIGGNDFTASVAEMAAAHAMLVNLGVYNEPHTIRRIQTDDGNVYEPQNQNIRALSSGSAYLVDQLMENNVNQNKYYNHMQILQSGYPVYAKTGTTDWGNDGLQYGIPSGAAKDKWMIASTSQYTNAVWYGFDQAIDGQMTYFPTWRDWNTPGQINRHMLDIESYISPDTIWGVSQPSDVQDVTYLYGTYPHVANDGANYGGKTITSQVSSTGLNYTPTQYASSYRNNNSYLAGLNASISNGIVYINWLTQDSCSGSRNISLKDAYNNISKSGACLAYNSFLQTSTNAKFYADLYQNDVYITSVTSKTNMYAGLPEYFKGNIKACGYFVTSGGKKSETICTDAGYYDPDATAAKDSK